MLEKKINTETYIDMVALAHDANTVRPQLLRFCSVYAR